MNYIYILVTGLVLSIPLLVGCKQQPSKEQETLSVTISPQQYFLEQIVGDTYDVNCIVPEGSNPESFDLSPSQMMTLSKSFAYFKVGFLGIENTLIEKVAETNPDIHIVDCSVGIEPMGGEDHIHADDTHQHDGHGGSADPHIWSSPQSAKTIADNMYKAISELNPKQKEQYTANYNKLVVELNNTDSIIKSYIAKAPSKSFIIYHPALSYFANEYGLNQYTIEYEGKNPSPSQLKGLIDKAKSEGVKVVFIQQEYDTKNAEIVAQAIGAKTIPINLLSYHWSEEMIKIARALSNE